MICPPREVDRKIEGEVLAFVLDQHPDQLSEAELCLALQSRLPRVLQRRRDRPRDRGAGGRRVASPAGRLRPADSSCPLLLPLGVGAVSLAARRGREVDAEGRGRSDAQAPSRLPHPPGAQATRREPSRSPHLRDRRSRPRQCHREPGPGLAPASGGCGRRQEPTEGSPLSWLGATCFRPARVRLWRLDFGSSGNAPGRTEAVAEAVDQGGEKEVGVRVVRLQLWTPPSSSIWRWPGPLQRCHPRPRELVDVRSPGHPPRSSSPPSGCGSRGPSGAGGGRSRRRRRSPPGPPRGSRTPSARPGAPSASRTRTR